MNKTAREIAKDVVTEFVQHSQICIDHKACVLLVNAIEAALLQAEKIEREVCARIADEIKPTPGVIGYYFVGWNDAGEKIAKRIRERADV